jgi:hypothetical protein
MKLKLSSLPILLILIIASAVRLYKIDNPIADWHSWRQADTAAVTRNFIKSGVDLLHPRFDDLSNIPSGKENPQGYRMVESPIYNFAHFTIYNTLQNSPLEALAKWGNLNPTLETTGRLIYYSRVILPDPMMVTTALGATWFFLKWLEITSKKPQGLHTSNSNNLDSSPGVNRTQNKNPSPGTNTPDLPSIFYFLLSAILASASILLKPTAIFLLLPLIYLAFRKHHLNILKQPLLYLYLALVLIPFVAWRLWIQNFPEGIPANFWLLNGDGIRFRPAWFRWLFYERLGNLILGGFGLIPFILGILTKPKKTEGLFYIFALCSLLLYLAIFATGNVRHDYYQIPLIPIVSIFFAKGIIELLTNKNFSKTKSIPTTFFLLLMTLFIGWYQVRGYYQINHPEIIQAGQAADRLLPSNARVIAPYQGDTAFLYQNNRPGWPAVTTDIENMINNLGATHYVSVNYDTTTNELMQKHPILEQTEDFIIIDLTSPLL